MNQIPRHRLSDWDGILVDLVATTLDGQPVRGPLVPAVSSELVAAEDRAGTDLSSTRLVLFVRDRLEHHPHFRGRASQFTVKLVGETIVMTGCLPSNYLKQLLQEAIKVIPGVVNIDNQVHVV